MGICGGMINITEIKKYNIQNKKQHVFNNKYTGVEYTAEYNVENSVNPSSTNNIIIEADNMDGMDYVKKMCNYKVDLIYMDPPYSTKRSVNNRKNTFLEKKYYDFEDNENWDSFMKPRFELSHDILSSDGSICCQIGTKKLGSCIGLLDEIYGENNQLAVITRKIRGSFNSVRFFNKNTDFIIVYAKDIKKCKVMKNKKRYEEEEYSKRFKHKNYLGRYYYASFRRSTVNINNNNHYYPIICPDGTEIFPDYDGKKMVWRYTRETYEKLALDHPEYFTFKKDEKGRYLPVTINYQHLHFNINKECLEEKEGVNYDSIITEYNNIKATKEQMRLWNGDVRFAYPKGSELMRYILGFFDYETVLDPFVGSGSTCAGVMLQQALDGKKNKKWIGINNNENNIFNVCYENILKFGQYFKKKYPNTEFDNGFRYVKINKK